ncbi:hypothetical protein KA107_02810 [Candidatus Pacearchaeota archaeon]|nr:hypothetical protein [Candidatus Pacearchaeota archaeon]
MKNTQQIKNEGELRSRLISDALVSGKQRVVIQAGHFPLHYSSSGAYASKDAWGAFTPYSLEIGTEVAKELRNHGIETKFIITADDINYDNVGENASFSDGQRRRMRRRFFREYSGESAVLPTSLREYLSAQGFSEQEVIRQDQGQDDRRDCLLFSERVLRTNPTQENNQCARAYRALVTDPKYFNMERDYLISFIPDRCTGNVCSRVLDENVRGLSASHVFMQTDGIFLPNTNRNSIWNDWGVHYRHDSPGGQNV